MHAGKRPVLVQLHMLVPVQLLWHACHTCHLDRGLKLMKACETVCLASQHLDSSDLFLLNHGKLPLSLSHEVLYQLIVLFVYLTVPAVRDKLFVHPISC